MVVAKFSINSFYIIIFRDRFDFICLLIFQVFSGNWNGKKSVRQILVPPVTAHLIRFHPTECLASNRCCMRVDLSEAGNC